MKRGGLLSIFLFVILINFVSAQYVFSLSDLFYTIDSTSLILVVLLVIFYLFVNQILGRVFKNRIAGMEIISFCISILMVYGIYKMNWNLSGFFIGLGVSEDTIFMVSLIIIGLMLIFALLKGWMRYFMLVLGGSLIISSLWTEIFYEWFTVFIMGIVLFVIGIWLSFKHRKNMRIRGFKESGRYPPTPRGKRRLENLQTKRMNFEEKQKYDLARKQHWAQKKRELKEKKDKVKKLFGMKKKIGLASR